MTNLKFTCMQCGTCCYEITEQPGSKRIPLYPEEVTKLISLSEKRGFTFQVIEDLVFPDIKNNKILIVTYRILLNNQNERCPFYQTKSGCSIHNEKPYACQAYPLSLTRIDAFNFKISIDPLCNFIIDNYDQLLNVDLDNLKIIFKDEFPKAEKFYRKNKRLQFKIQELEYEGKIEIPRELLIKDFNRYLNQWEREEIIVR